MNDTTIETILAHAPSPAAPPELLERLQAAIVLQPAKLETNRFRPRQNPLRRRFPALAFGLLIISSAVMFAMQANRTAALKQQNETLRAAAAALPQLREQHTAWEKAVAQQQELDDLRKDNQEMHQLQAEAARLQNLSAQVQRLREENQQLSAAPVANNSATARGFFEDAEKQAERIQCVNNLKQLGLAMHIWAGDHNHKFPTSLTVMTNELYIKFLICPGDKSRQSYSTLSWSEFQDGMNSYQYLAQPDDINFPDCIVAKCPIHSNYLLADGSVQEINPATVHEVQKDGRWYLQLPTNPGSNQ